MENKNVIRAVYDDKTIRVYQAFNETIASEAVSLGTFGKSFKLTRMTWIKPSFLWMMYRSGWGKKENQTHTLAIDITRDGWDELLKNGVLTSYKENPLISKEDWSIKTKSSEILIQWDPEKDINGNNLNYRSIQIGLRGTYVNKYINEFIVKITDISDYVKNLRDSMKSGVNIESLLPKEKEYFFTANEGV